MFLFYEKSFSIEKTILSVKIAEIEGMYLMCFKPVDRFQFEPEKLFEAQVGQKKPESLVRSKKIYCNCSFLSIKFSL